MDLKMIDFGKDIKSLRKVKFPNGEPKNNFTFSAIDEDGTFRFHFRWINERWNCWVTLPSGEERTCSVYANVISWTGFLDYGIVFSTELKEISFSDLFSTELYIIKWQ